jgi:uncharacterized alkaline shock family protein YloU
VTDTAPPDAAQVVLDEAVVEAAAIAAAVRLCPSVADLSGGRFGEVATYLPGRRVTGVRIGDRAIDVHCVGRYGVPIPVLATQIRTALAPLVGGRPINIRVEDLELTETA